jgi:succinate dehydrogenase/fumarate reductase flavoprotein subunit
MAILVAIVLALLVAAGVLLAASISGSSRSAGESPLRAFRAGWAARKNPDSDQRAAAAAAAVEPVDMSLAQFLRETVDEGEAYLQVDDLAATLQRARDKAVGVLPGNHHR